ncbi:MAG: endonuclease MutS2 [Gemmatimonadota bacterium]|nr:endonuclease MutS2 [Gemmatimonadota bacterium]
MNAHALHVLELPAVLAIVAERASSPLGAARVRGLEPSRDPGWIRDELARVAAVRALAATEGGWNAEPIPDLYAALRRLRAAGSVWRGEELLAGASLLRSSRLTRATLLDERRRSLATALLAPFAARLVEARPSEETIQRAIDAEGLVKDDASPALRRMRRELRGAQAELVQLLERAMARLDGHQRVADMSVTVRNGRYVIPIRREGRAVVGGIVHDESATGATLFVEPPEAVEFGNRIRALEAEEAREVHRILRELTDRLHPLHGALTDALEALVELDALYARARFAAELRCAPVDLARPGEGFALHDGRHPLLLARGGEVVPFDLEMVPGERTLLLSGPNTGGKTVLLKAIGLVSAMTQAGIPAPVGEGSRVAVFDDFFADIGDEQSIEASLSTFSAHVKNLGEILGGATTDSLALIDELGSGTDPAEGAALGGAILEELTRRGTMTVASTHLGQLKLVATEVAGVVNASLQFDEQALAPTYRLIKGIPGRSYGLGIARRLRLPDNIISRAEQRLPRGERDVAALLASLELREAELAERELALTDESESAVRRNDNVDERERGLRLKERELEKRSRQEAREYLLEARREVERVIKGLKAAAEGATEDAMRDARRHIESLAEGQAQALEEIERTEPHDRDSNRGRTASPVPAELAEGDRVEVQTLGGRVGQIVGFRGSDATVAIGGMKLTVPRTALGRKRDREPLTELQFPVYGDLPDVYASSEVDLRGMHVDEIDGVVMQALDSAIRAGLASLRIIHGKGTGALRDRVAELLRVDDRIKGFRLGAWNEGGAGVTVVQLG